MPSGLDLLGEQPKKTGLELLGEPVEIIKKATSGLELLAAKPVVEPAVVSKEPKELAPVTTLPVSAFDLQTGEFDPYKTSPIIGEEFKEEFISGVGETMSTLEALSNQPMEIIRGAASFLWSLPGFGMGVVGAVQKMTERIAHPFNLNDLYEAAAEGMEKEASWWHRKMVEPLFGKPTPEAEIVGQTAMAPLLTMSMVGYGLSKLPIFEDHPNVQGILKFAGDIGGLLAMKRVFHASPEVVKEVEGITNKARNIADREMQARSGYDDALMRVNLETLKMEKKQLELRAKALKDKLDKQGLKEGVKEVGEKVEEVKGEPRLVRRFEEIKEEPITEAPLATHGTDVVELEGILSEGLRPGSAIDLSPGREWSGESPIVIELPGAKPGEYVAHNKYYKVANQPKPSKVIIDLDQYDAAAAEKVITDVTRWRTENPDVTFEVKGVVPGKEGLTKSNVSDFFQREYELDKKTADEMATEAIKDIREGTIKSTYGYDKTIHDIKGLREYYKWLEEAEKADPITEVDLQTGTEIPPELSTERSPFRTPLEETTQLRDLYEGRKLDDPDLAIGKLTNDVNRWLEGEEVDIAEVRNQLSNIAAHADNARTLYATLTDFEQFKRTAGEAADWARKAEREADVKIIEPEAKPLTEKEAVDRMMGILGPERLNVMIPVDQIPAVVTSLLLDVKKGAVALKDLYRNKKIWKKTGFWLGKDEFWRFEIDDSKMEHLKAFNSQFTELRLNEVIDYPELFEAIPEMRYTKVTIDPELKFGGTYGIDNDTIILRNLSPDSLLHEVQHAVNYKVGSVFTGTSVEYQTALVNAKQVLARLESVVDLAKTEEVKDYTIKSIAIVKDQIAKREINNNIAEWYFSTYLEHAKGLEGEMIGDVFPLVKSGKFRYTVDPGEMEARLTEARLEMTPKEKAKEPPWKTLDTMLDIEGIAGIPGEILYDIGGATAEGIKQIISGARKVSDYTTKARGIKKFHPKEATRALKEEFNREWVDRSGNIRKQLLDKLGDTGYEIIQKMYLSKGASSLAANYLRQMRKEVYGGLSRELRKILDDVLLADRMVDIAGYKTKKQFKYPGGAEPKDFIAYRGLFQFKSTNGLRNLTNAEVLRINKAAEAYFNWMRKPLKDMLDSGLITEQEFIDLSSHNYRRIKLVDVFDKRYGARLGGRKRIVYDSGIEALARGRDTDIYEPSSEIMALEVFNRSYGRILNNEANRTLLELARKDPENPFVRVKTKGKKMPSGWGRIFLFENGERKAIYLSPEMSKEWITNNPELKYRTAQIIRYASGSVVLRTFATGINWGFALANVPRDIQHIWFAARVYEDGKWKSLYNPVGPVYAMQISRDIAAVFSDAVMRRGRYEKYIEEGGGMEFLVHQGRITQRGRHIEGPLSAFQDYLGYFGETSEIMTRLAIRERVIRRRAKEQGISIEEARKKEDITREAAFAARDYMDFGQGGTISKAMDNAIPYLNASIQGTRGLWRAIRDNKAEATFKLAQYAAVVTGLYIAAQKLAPETMKNLKGSIDNQNNLCIPMGDQFGFLDDKGQQRYLYFKIPLDPGQKFFKTFFEASTDKWLGNEIDIDTVTGSLKQFSPVGGAGELLFPTAAAGLGYTFNKDFWLNEDIWRSTEPFKWPGSQAEFIPGQTPQAYIDLGGFTGLSPERTRYMVEELTTSGTIWSYLLGKGYNLMTEGVAPEKKQQHLAHVLARTPVIKRFLGVTNPYTKFATKIDKARTKIELENFIETRDFDPIVEGYLYGKGVSRQDVFDKIKSYPDVKTRNRLRDRFRWEENIKSLPEKSFWKRMKGLPIEAKARVFVDRLESANEKEKKQLWKEYSIVSKAGGVISKQFRKEVSKLRGK